MNAQMDVLYLTKTGHVLSAFTRSAEPPQLEKSPNAFTGDNLVVRGLGDPLQYVNASDYNNEEFQFPATLVSLFRTDLNPNFLAEPRELCLTDLDKPTPTLGLITNSFPAPGAPPPPPFNLPLQITLPSPAAQDTPVFVLVEGSALSAPLPITTKISATSTTTSVAVPGLATGAYYGLVFVATYPVLVMPFNVP